MNTIVEEERCDRCGFKVQDDGNLVGGRMTCDPCVSVLHRSDRDRAAVRDDRTYLVECDGVPRFDVPGPILRGWLGGGHDVFRWKETEVG